MRKVNIHDAETQLSKLVEQAAAGEPFIIAKAGKPLVTVMALETPTGGQVHRIGFLRSEIPVPADFDQIGAPKLSAFSAALIELLLDTHVAQAVTEGFTLPPTDPVVAQYPASVRRLCVQVTT